MQHKASQYYGMSALSRVLEGLTKPAFKKRGFAEHRVITDWEKIVGTVIARYSTPQKLVFPPETRERGVLHVDVYDSAFATEIHYLGPLICEKIAAYFGYLAVERLNITQKPMIMETDEIYAIRKPMEDIAALEVSVAGIEDAEVREALKSLGQYVL